MDPRAFSRFRKNRGALVGASIVGFLLVFALFAPLLSGHDPNVSDFEKGRGLLGMPVGLSSEHWLGTDTLFRDQWSRLAHGARLSLQIAFAASAIALVIGTFVGILAGWNEGKPSRKLLGLDLDTLLMRFVDIGLSFPFLLLVMAIGAALDRTTTTTIFIVLGLTGWLGTARLVRSKTIQVRELDFISASRALGQSTPLILVKHVLPNVAGVLVVVGTISIAQMIIAESVLSYLNVGVQPPTPTWGRMLYEGQDSYMTAPWLIAAPGLAILFAVLGFNLLGEGLRDALDPREH